MKRTPSERITLQQFADMLGLSYVRTKIIARANAERLDKRIAEHVAGRPASLDRAACVRFAAERGGEMSRKMDDRSIAATSERTVLVEIPNRYTNACQWAGDIEDTGSSRRNLGAAIKAALLTGTDLTDAVLTDADLRGADLTDADLRGAVLTGAVLTDAVLTGAVLTGAVLTGADLRDAVLTGADLRDADLTDAVLRGAVLTGAVLTGAVLTDADLRGADLTDAVLRGAVLTDADLRGAVLRDVKISALRAMSGLYRYQTWAFTTDSGVPWVRMGCLWKSVEEWDRIGIRASNRGEFPDDGSERCEERVRAFEFARAAALRLAEMDKDEEP